MANYGRGWESGYGSQEPSDIERYWDEEALRQGDWDWLDKSPRYQKLLKEQENND